MQNEELSKNKKRKERIQKGMDDENENNEEKDEMQALEDESSFKKRKRLALYGVRK